jgi:hypothetical protein
MNQEEEIRATLAAQKVEIGTRAGEKKIRAYFPEATELLACIIGI